jgi:hypothetical protein
VFFDLIKVYCTRFVSKFWLTVNLPLSLNISISLHLIQALVHVSTAYCNCDRSDVAEAIYTPPYSPDDIISLVQWLPEDLLDKVKIKSQRHLCWNDNWICKTFIVDAITYW